MMMMESLSCITACCLQLPTIYRIITASTTKHNAHNRKHATPPVVSVSTLYLEFWYFLIVLCYRKYTITPQNQTTFLPDIIALVMAILSILAWCFRYKHKVLQKPKTITTFILTLCLGYFVYTRALVSKEYITPSISSDDVASSSRKIAQYVVHYTNFEYLLLIPTFLQLKALHLKNINIWSLVTNLLHSAVTCILLILHTTTTTSATALINTHNPYYDYHSKLLILHYGLLVLYSTVLIIQWFLYPQNGAQFAAVARVQNDEEVVAAAQREKLRLQQEKQRLAMERFEAATRGEVSAVQSTRVVTTEKFTTTTKSSQPPQSSTTSHGDTTNHSGATRVRQRGVNKQ